MPLLSVSKWNVCLAITLGLADAYFWNGSALESATLPDELPRPAIKFRKDDEAGGVKNYGGGESPVRWLKSGDLELLSEHTEMAHESGRTYTATITSRSTSTSNTTPRLS